MDYGFFIFTIIMCIIGIFRAIEAHREKKRGKEILAICGCILLLALGLCSIAFDMKAKINTDATINIDDSLVEESSVLYFFDNYIDGEITSGDIKKLLGDSCIENTVSSTYIMRYPTSKYTLNHVASDYITAAFDRNGLNEKIFSIAWQYEEPDVELYNALLDYLSSVLGEPDKKATSSTGSSYAKWPGFSLECDRNRVSFIRGFH